MDKCGQKPLSLPPSYQHTSFRVAKVLCDGTACY